jgi:MFS family permease
MALEEDMMSEGSGSAGRKTFALVLLCCASFVAVLDLTIVAIALPSVRRELGFSGGDAQWILTGYALSFGGLLLFMGRTGDLYGRRLLFVGGLAVFGAASLLGGLAWAPWVLVAARLLQGVGGAALGPASLALVSATFAEGEERNRAMGVYGAMAGVEFVFGMVLGGVITKFLGWRWVLFVNVPVPIGVLLLAPIVIQESKDEAAPRTLDLTGAPGAGAAGATPDLVPARRGRPEHSGRPQINGRRPQLYVLTLYFQDALGRTPLEAGLLFVPMTVASVVASPVAGRLTSRLDARQTATWGFAMSGAGLVLVAWLMPHKDALVAVLFGMAVAEAGFVTASVPLTTAATDGVGDDERGLASGVLSTATELGNALGWAAVAAVIAAATAASDSTLLGGLRWGLWSATAYATVAFVLVVVCMGPGSQKTKWSSSNAAER